MNVDKLSKALRTYADANTAHDAAIAKLNAVQGEVTAAQTASAQALAKLIETAIQITK